MTLAGKEVVSESFKNRKHESFSLSKFLFGSTFLKKLCKPTRPAVEVLKNTEGQKLRKDF